MDMASHLKMITFGLALEYRALKYVIPDAYQFDPRQSTQNIYELWRRYLNYN